LGRRAALRRGGVDAATMAAAPRPAPPRRVVRCGAIRPARRVLQVVPYNLPMYYDLRIVERLPESSFNSLHQILGNRKTISKSKVWSFLKHMFQILKKTFF